jgi:PAS domain S-box-containing protein
MEKESIKTSVFDNIADTAWSFVDLMKTCLRNTPYGFCFINTEKIILYINNIVEEITGYSQAELVGRHVAELEFISPDVIGNILHASRRNRGVDNKPLIFEFEIMAKGGNRKYLAITVIPINNKEGNGELIGTLIFVFDHSETKKMLDKLQFSDIVLKSIRDGVMLIDNDMVITEWNEACENIFGVRSSEVIGQKLFDIVEVLSPSSSEIRLLHQKLLDDNIRESTILKVWSG